MPAGSDGVVLIRSPNTAGRMSAISTAITGTRSIRRAFPLCRPLMVIGCDSDRLIDSGRVMLRPGLIGGWRLLLGARGLNEMTALHDDFIDRALAAILWSELTGLKTSVDAYVVALVVGNGDI